MQSGGFFSAEDADSFESQGDEKKREGAFAVWKKEELVEVLGDEKVSQLHSISWRFREFQIDDVTLFDIATVYYGVEDDGNAPPYTVRSLRDPTIREFRIRTKS